MGVAWSSGHRWTRRTFLGALPFAYAAGVQPGAEFPSEQTVYTDRTTEFEVTRFTHPGHSSYLPHYYNKFISRRHGFLLYTSDRTGSLQAYELNLKTGTSRLLTSAAGLEPWSLHLLPDQRQFVYFDRGDLMRGSTRRPGVRLLYRAPAGFQPEQGLSVSEDGKTIAFTETNGKIWRLRLFDLKRRKASVVLTASERLSEVQIHPHARLLLFRRNGGWWIVAFNGKKPWQLDLAPGMCTCAVWSGAATSVLYLNIPDQKGRLNTLREFFADTRQDRLIAKTTQFVAFGANADTSVFVGASGARATPYILLLLRVGGRELTLCEHSASDPTRVQPVFSPDSRWIYFQSDRDGNSSLYGVRVEGLVESTD